MSREASSCIRYGFMAKLEDYIKQECSGSKIGYCTKCEIEGIASPHCQICGTKIEREYKIIEFKVIADIPEEHKLRMEAQFNEDEDGYEFFDQLAKMIGHETESQNLEDTEYFIGLEISTVSEYDSETIVPLDLTKIEEYKQAIQDNPAVNKDKLGLFHMVLSI